MNAKCNEDEDEDYDDDIKDNEVKDEEGDGGDCNGKNGKTPPGKDAVDSDNKVDGSDDGAAGAAPDGYADAINRRGDETTNGTGDARGAAADYPVHRHTAVPAARSLHARLTTRISTANNKHVSIPTTHLHRRRQSAVETPNDGINVKFTLLQHQSRRRFDSPRQGEAGEVAPSSPLSCRHAPLPSLLTVNIVGAASARTSPPPFPPRAQHRCPWDPPRPLKPEKQEKSAPSPLAVGAADASNGPSSVASAYTISQQLAMEGYIKLPSPERWRLLVKAMAKEKRAGRALSAGGGRSLQKRAAIPSPANQTPPSVIGVSNVGSNDNNTDDSIMLPALVEFPTPPRAKWALEVVIEKDNVMTAGTPAGALAAKMTAFPTPADQSPPSVIGVGAVKLDSDDVDDSIRLPAWRSGRRSW